MTPYSNNHNSEEGNGAMSSSSRSNNNPNAVKAPCVCFDAEPDMHLIEQIEELPADIVEAVWYEEEEIADMIADAKGVLEGTNKEDDPRGLESHSYQGGQIRRRERSKASEAVLGEQLRQTAMRACEDAVIENADELIAEEYRKVSKRHQELAYKRAQSDARAASDGIFQTPLLAVKNWFSDRNLVKRASDKNMLSASSDHVRNLKKLGAGPPAAPTNPMALYS